MMTVGDVFIDECQGFLPAMELDAAVQIACQSRQVALPSGRSPAQTRLSNGTATCIRRNGIERLLDACHDDLAAQIR